LINLCLEYFLALHFSKINNFYIFCFSDILILTDLFQSVRKEIYESRHGLDAARYLTSGSLAVDASLKMSKSSIQLLTSHQMHLLWEDSLRGGYVCVSQRFARSNQPDLPGYKPEEELSALLYLDKNNLYGWATISFKIFDILIFQCNIRTRHNFLFNLEHKIMQFEAKLDDLRPFEMNMFFESYYDTSTFVHVHKT
jgi:hypothetical protein